MGQIVVVGAGQAGASLTAKLRNLGYDGGITLIGAEAQPPYQRPPLSKAYLMGEMEQERLFLRPRRFYEDQGIALRLGKSVSGIDAAARTVSLGREKLAYDALVLTTGSEPRRLPDAIGGGLKGVFTVRSLADIDAMAPEVADGRRVLVIGGGYIGLEAAAVAAKKGMKVTLVEMAERILGRVAAPETSDYFRNLHRAHGVEIIEGVGLERLTGEDKVTGAVLSDGRKMDIDMAIVGVGIAPSITLAQGAGLKIDNGIHTDAQGRTSDPAIWSAGDCASFPWRGARIRLESVQNAIDQAEVVAENLMGAQKDYDPHPWFWSDQYDVKLQIAGLNTGFDRLVVRPGEKDGAVSHWYYGRDRLLAVDAMNDPRAYMVGKRLIEAGRSPDAGQVGDASFDIKSLLKP